MDTIITIHIKECSDIRAIVTIEEQNAEPVETTVLYDSLEGLADAVGDAVKDYLEGLG